MQNPKVLIIYTGGTIGMINDPQTGALKPFDFEHLYGCVPELKQFDYELETYSFGEPIDSSDMNPEIWATIAQTIFDKYADYDGFVVLHGTDTMAYTASALSFMLQGLKKPVIFTGSQLPIGQIRTDGKENLITAIEVAGLRDNNGQPLIQEVALYFEFCLLRGNRTSKVNAENFEAFSSYNYPLLAEAGVHINFDKNALFRSPLDKLQLGTSFNQKISLISIYPGMQLHPLKSLFDIKVNEAILLETFGSGNVFTSTELRDMMKSYLDEGGIILNISQCQKGSVELGKYQTSQVFLELDVCNGWDLTREAALTKLMYVLGQTKDRKERLILLEKNISGELTIT
ncbi:MAG: asparaginase [Flavobacteriales bacterium]|nr:asparaginase [Flavobacteriales bacterium]